VPVAGVILNRVASDRHARLVTEACEALNLPVFGALYRDAMPRLEERHLGLVQAGEVPQLEALLDRLAEAMAAALDLDRLQGLARPAHGAASAAPPLTAPAGRIALARDDAFSFLYPHLLAAWRAAGTSILPFSPLADEAPDATADLVWLPGGYPELHAGRLAGNHRFIAGLQGFAGPIHGECGGYMVLGQGMIDAGGTRHAMAGLLGLESDFSRRKLHLGYRLAKSLEPSPLGPPGTRLRGHEFHYASIAGLGGDAPLFETTDAAGKPLPPQGSRRGRVTGSFFHMIAPA
jgi:cobyrinic acid a,c-diamide synthase